MQSKTRYRDVAAEVGRELASAAKDALEAGIDRRSVLVDPGFGFAKTAAQNLQLLARLDRFADLGFPVLAGLSRKSFLAPLTGAAVNDRLYGSLGAAAAAIYGGAHVLRVHDVLAHRHLAGVIDGTLGEREWTFSR
jgi:dihydropteroate synthase